MGAILGSLFGLLLGWVAFSLTHANKVSAVVGRTCGYTCPVIHWTWQTQVIDVAGHYTCPEGWTLSGNKCKKSHQSDKNATWVDTTYKNVDHSADVAYNKLEDDNMCHRPSDSVLTNTYGMDHDTRDDFKKHNDESVYGTPNACPSPTLEPTATPTLEPTGTPTPESTPTPEATPSAEPSQAPQTPYVDPGQHYSWQDPAGTPQCTDGNTILLPANPHVIRKGTTATVNWFETQGDSANIYYKEVKSANWQFSVRDIPVTGGYGSVTINDLKPNVGYTFGIEQKFGCAGGQLAIAVIVDGPQCKTFPITYWMWGK